MKVLFDHQLFSWQRYGGASKYFAMLLSHLPSDIWETSTWLSNNAYVEHLNLFPYKRFLPSFYFRGQGRFMHEIGKFNSIIKLYRKKYDIYHQTHFDPYGLPFIGHKPMVTTFHDINFSTINPNPKVVKWQRKSLERADFIISISENTRQDLMRLFNVPESKTTVIYHGIIPPPQLPTTKIFDFPYILYVGARDNYKNFHRLIDAFSITLKTFPDLKLVCTWKSFSPHEHELFRRLNIDKNIEHYSATESEMNTLYRDALFFIFPSLYEGFGMPILEAMTNHCPVLLSNSSCFPEIAQDAAMYFDPKSVDDMSDKMNMMVENSELRNMLVQKGDLRVKYFSWERCAAQHLKIYESLL